MFVVQFRRYIQLAVLILFLPLGVVSDQINAAPSQVDPSGYKLLIVGDSLSAAYGLQQQEGWVSLLQNMWRDDALGIDVINAAISGETTDGGLARLPRLLNQHQPTHVLIELGGNDGLQGHPVTKMQKNLDTMVKMARDAGAEVIIQDMQIPANYGKRYTTMFGDAYDTIADENQAVLIPFFLENVALDAQLMQRDGIHPNKEAQPLIAEFMYKQLTPLIKGGGNAASHAQ